jgi:hypothetical protein
MKDLASGKECVWSYIPLMTQSYVSKNKSRASKGMRCYFDDFENYGNILYLAIDKKR